MYVENVHKAKSTYVKIVANSTLLLFYRSLIQNWNKILNCYLCYMFAVLFIILYSKKNMYLILWIWNHMTWIFLCFNYLRNTFIINKIYVLEIHLIEVDFIFKKIYKQWKLHQPFFLRPVILTGIGITHVVKLSVYLVLRQLLIRQSLSLLLHQNSPGISCQNCN